MRWCLVLFPILLLLFVPSETGNEVQAAAKKRPNIVFILTDDQDPASYRRMPALQKLVARKGVRFTNSYVTTPQCCPSRTTMLRGQYAHNHGIRNNKLPSGGAIKFRRSGLDRSTIATWMNAAGYDTAYIGKYLNQYNSRYVPPGWDRWYGFMGNYNSGGPRKYRINENGRRRTYNRQQLHDTDYMAKKATQFIKARKGSRKPWFVMIAPNAPHTPAYAAKRHEKLYRKARLSRVPSLNERDASNKPSYVRNTQYSGADARAMTKLNRQRLRSLKSVDEMVGSVVRTLRKSRQLNNTYIVYTTDNGYMLGRHRLKTKGVPYEESIKAPLIVRGPGVPRGVTSNQLVASTDWAPTLADWSGVSTPEFVDGRSLSPLLSKTSSPEWRDQLLIEFWLGGPAFSGLRTAGGMSYVEYANGEKELYNLNIDPYQLNNNVNGASPETLESLSSDLAELKACAAESCREAEGP